jgi:hypothetical protein
MAVVFPAEAHVVVVDGEQAMVGDGDPVCIPTHVIQHLLGPPKGGLGVDHPFGGPRRSQILGEGLPIVQAVERRGEAQLASGEGLVQILEKQTTEQAGQHPHWQEEAGAAGHPAGAIGREAAPRDDAVQMRMMEQILPPRVQHGEEADLGPQVVRIGRNDA